jgi:tetratricopeptide (TPR) repeat protein
VAGRFDEAKALIDKCRADVVESSDPVLKSIPDELLGVCQTIEGSLDEAIATLRRTWRYAVDNGTENRAAQIGHNLTEALLARGDAAEAAKMCLELLTLIGPDDTYARNGVLSNHGLAYLMLGDPATAIANFRIAAERTLYAGYTADALETLLWLGAALASADPGDDMPALLLGAFTAGYDELGILIPPGPCTLIETYLAPHRDAPSSSRRGAARKAGAERVLTLGAAKAADAVIAELLERAQ